METRKDEIVDWHIRESGAAAPAAEFEYAITLRDFHEASSYPYRVEGRILPADIEGKESRVYRRPVGRGGGDQPVELPMHLSNRSVAPALALGNAVVLKPAGDTPVTGGLLLAKVYEEAGLPRACCRVVIGSGSGHRRRDRAAPDPAGGVVHRLHAGRQGHRREGRAEEALAGARRQRSAGGARRRRPRATRWTPRSSASSSTRARSA